MRFFSVLFATALSCVGAFAETKELPKITWIRWDDPPIFIFEGPYKGQGVLDVVEKELKQALPQYQHESINANVPRVLKEAEEKSQICNAGWLNTPEWAKYFYFSKPVFVIPSNGILLKESHLKDLKNLKTPYGLQEFLDKKIDWILGIGRLYGEGIDDILKKNNYQKNPKILILPSSLLVHRMLYADRVQYALGYPFEAEYYNELLGNKDNRVVYIPLKDNADFVEVVVGCPKSPWGEKIIADVNKALTNKALLERNRKGVDRWLSPKDQKSLEVFRAKSFKKHYPSLGW